MTPRIVSLVPSLTELVCELGLRDQLVGRTGFCVHPAKALADVPKVGGTKAVDIDRIRALRPTHLIVSREENERATVAEIARFVPEIVVTDAYDLPDNRALYERFGDLFGVRNAAQALCEAFDQAVWQLMSQRHEPVPVLYLIWKSPWMTVTRNTFISSMLRTAGMHTMPACTGASDAQRYPVIADATFAELKPAAVLLSSEPFRFRPSHLAQVRTLAGAGAVCELIDGEMTSWYGPRAIAGLGYLGRFRNALDKTLASRP